MLRLPPHLAELIHTIADHIDPADLTGKGYVDDPHVTLRHDVEPGARPTLGEIPIALHPELDAFLHADSGDGHDVLFAPLEDGTRVMAARDQLPGVAGTASPKPFHAHVTIAYLRPGTAAKYVDRLRLPPEGRSGLGRPFLRDSDGGEYDLSTPTVGLSDTFAGPPRAGLVPQTGDAQHPGHWIRPEAATAPQPHDLPSDGQPAAPESSLAGRALQAVKSVGSAALDTKVGRIAKLLEHKLSFLHHKSRDLVAAAAAKRGFTAEQTARLGRILALSDTLISYGAAPVIGATLSPLAGKAAAYLPTASVAYLIYSTARNPAATWAAARQVIGETSFHPKGLVNDAKAAWKGDAKHAEAFAADGFADRLADYLEGADDADWAEAMFLAAVAAGHDPDEALTVVAEAIERQPKPTEATPTEADFGGETGETFAAEPVPIHVPGVGKPASGEVALAGADGRDLNRLIAEAKQHGIDVLNMVAETATRRALKAGGVKGELLDADEQEMLAEALASVLATADLLGRSRIREHADNVKAGNAGFAERASETFAATPAIEIRPPKGALDYFLSLYPSIDVDPEAWTQQMMRDAFWLAASTNEELTKKIQDAIGAGVAGGGGLTETAGTVESLLDAAGVTPANPQYSELVTRVAVMRQYNHAAYEEGRSPDLQDTFPAWMYLSIIDYLPNGQPRGRIKHRDRNRKIYPASASFNEVRGMGIEELANCRCSMSWLEANQLAEMLASGARIETSW